MKEVNPISILYGFTKIQQNDRIYVETSKHSRILDNIRKNNLVYFCFDHHNPPYKGAKNSGIVNIYEEIDNNLEKGKKIWLKYLGSLDHPVASSLVSYMRKMNQLS